MSIFLRTVPEVPFCPSDLPLDQSQEVDLGGDKASFYFHVYEDFVVF